MKKGIAMPIVAKMIWKPSEIAICERAANRSVMIVVNSADSACSRDGA
jgi:hypothetical protein